MFTSENQKLVNIEFNVIRKVKNSHLLDVEEAGKEKESVSKILIAP